MGRKPRTLRFDAFELDCDNRQLRRHGRVIELGSRYFDALALLVTRRGELVTKQAFMDAVWQGIPVTDEALTQCIRTLRRALGDDAANPRFIATVPKHGYRFVAAEPRSAGARARPRVSQLGGACALTGLAAGAVAGLVYGMIAGTGGGGQVMILAAMIGALGLIAGSGLGAGMAAAIAWRGRADAWVVAGTAMGGLCVGALGNLLGREGVALLSGVPIANVTGPFEGAVIGTATGLVAWVALAGGGRLAVLSVSVVSGLAAAGLIFLSGGTLLAGSLQALQHGLSGFRLDVAKIGFLAGEPGLTRTALGWTLAIESQIFIFAIAGGLLVVRRRLIEPDRS
ncbi:transcriptional regulator [Croceicoccus sp. BE223]|uniref:winged helix-turn-helix domain-containing protein n=1 Tax=Croceicoccus sp. BE223 TaxID=2817716 RepID=UPI002864C2EC|nr:transcriptional regulator [Croceicoccus sp. BE223]MDR7102730.1 DNA-binding winged helix-turn-helix (wHTH) protein [Croceicoccus sp. BE223]